MLCSMKMVRGMVMVSLIFALMTKFTLADCQNLQADEVINISDANNATVLQVVTDGVIKVGEPFSTHIYPCDKDIEITAIDATMPAHGHGMNYQTELLQVDEGEYLANGLLFHMPGVWRIDINIKQNGVRKSVTKELTIDP